jgi:sortase A
LSILEGFLLAAGGILLIIYGLALVDRHISSGVALRDFEKREGAAAVDFALWSERRVKEYKSSLLVTSDPPIAALRIEKLKIRVPVFPNTGEFSLNRGAGWIAGTARPGESGNIGIAGHRDGFFRGLKEITTGDLIELESVAWSAVYAVDQIEIVEPHQVSVLQPRAQPSLTLVTCYPFYFVGSAPLRFIVHAALKRPAATERLSGQFTLALPNQIERKEKGR